MRNEKAQITGGIVALGITLIMAVIVLGVAFSFIQTEALTSTQSVTNETVVISSGAGRLANAKFIALNHFGNNTHEYASNLGNAINISSVDGYIKVSANITNGNYNASYNYLPTGYIESGTNRTLIATVPILLAVTLIVFSAGFVILKG
jgi:hypothetical protein